MSNDDENGIQLDRPASIPLEMIELDSLELDTLLKYLRSGTDTKMTIKDDVDLLHSAGDKMSHSIWIIETFSENLKIKHSELSNHFREWKFHRQNLLQLLTSYVYNRDKNSSLVSGFRIFTSVAGILGIMMKPFQGSSNSFANLLMENSAECGVLGLFMKMYISKKTYEDVRNVIKKDQQSFEKISQWFKETEELDAAIKSFFPYGIDKDEVMKIHRRADNLEDCQKLFIAIVASNVKKNRRLLNKNFLGKVERFSTSDAGNFWFIKVILENDFGQPFNSTLCEEVRALMKTLSTENREAYVDACKILPSTNAMKVMLNSATIVSATSALWLAGKSDELDALEKLMKNLDEELDAIQNIVRLLELYESEIDPILIK